MKITVMNNKIVCSLDNKNHDFLYECTGCFDGFEGYGFLQMNYATTLKEEWTVRENYKTLKTVLFWAERYNIEVDEEVKQQFIKWRNKIDEWDNQQAQINAKYYSMEKWQKLKKYGCWSCKYKTYSEAYDDEFICMATHESLPTEDIGLGGDKADIGKYYKINALFCLAPYPLENCPFKTEDLDKTDPNYIKWKEDEMLSGF